MDEGRNGGRAFHSIRQPDVEGNLGTFTYSADKEEGRDGSDRPGRHFRSHLEDIGIVQRTKSGPDQKDSQGKAKVPDPVDNKGFLAGVGSTGPVKPEANQQIAAKTD